MKPFKPDPELFVKHHPRLKHLKPDALALLKRATVRYYEYSPTGMADGNAYKAAQEVLEGSGLWMLWCGFFHDGYLNQLLWIPD